MRIGLKIKKLRMEQNMSVEELASKLGKNKATVYRYEKGDIESLPLDALEPLAKALNTTPAYLIGWESKPDKKAVTVYEFLKSVRLQQHMTVEEFSKEIGITAEDLRKYESGDKYMPIEMINTISNRYSISRNPLLNNLLKFTDEEYNKILEYANFLIYIREVKS